MNVCPIGPAVMLIFLDAGTLRKRPAFLRFRTAPQGRI